MSMLGLTLALALQPNYSISNNLLGQERVRVEDKKSFAETMPENCEQEAFRND
jgi:hypothetical protein